MSTGDKKKPIAKEKLYGVLLAPQVTEKATAGSAYNQVSFKVARDATKPQVKAAVEQLFNVKVRAVNTVVVKGKTKRFRGIESRRSDWKKAIVTLAEGSAIDVTTGI
jgi:large subunit ribosomal protein L23